MCVCNQAPLSTIVREASDDPHPAVPATLSRWERGAWRRASIQLFAIESAGCCQGAR